MGKTKYIDADRLLAGIYSNNPEDVMLYIATFPAADVVPVIRCAECKYQDKGENDCEVWNLCGYRPWLHIPTEDDAFCSKGERKDG